MGKYFKMKYLNINDKPEQLKGISEKLSNIERRLLRIADDFDTRDGSMDIIARTIRNHGNKILSISEKVTDQALALEDARLLYHKAEEECFAQFQETDPMGKEHERIISNPVLSFVENQAISFLAQPFLEGAIVAIPMMISRAVQYYEENDAFGISVGESAHLMGGATISREILFDKRGHISVVDVYGVSATTGVEASINANIIAGKYKNGLSDFYGQSLDLGAYVDDPFGVEVALNGGVSQSTSDQDVRLYSVGPSVGIGVSSPVGVSGGISWTKPVFELDLPDLSGTYYVGDHNTVNIDMKNQKIEITNAEGK